VVRARDGGKVTTQPALAIDLGGTKTLAALVDGKIIVEEREIATPWEQTADRWCDTIVNLAEIWRDSYGAAGVAVTGLVDKGKWSTLNPAVLAVPNHYPLEKVLQNALGVPVHAVNDAQAAAWGEYRHGTAQGRDLVYVTISTGIGGGVVADGRLLQGRSGLAGSIGQLRLVTGNGTVRIEDIASGSWIGSEAARRGRGGSAKDVFEAAAKGEGWACDILERAERATAVLLRNIQLLFAPEVVVIGGSVGLAGGYLEKLRAMLSELPAVERPELVRSGLGKHAGVIGAADLARSLVTGGG
jgi:predicted NBD/HSP70 family sugar kinase